MGNAFSVATKILGEDLASEVFNKVGGAARKAFAPIRAFNSAVAKPETHALGRVGAAVDKVASKFRAGIGSISAWLPALGAIGSVATLGGLIAMSKSAAEGFEGLTLSAEKLGVSTRDLAAWRLGAKMTGVDAEAMEKGLIKLKKAMYDAATGKNKDVAALFAAMKIPLRDAAGNVKNVDASLDDLAEAFKNTGDEEVKSRAALALFGKSGADMLPFLNRGRAGLAEWREEMKKYSGLTDANRRDLSHLAESYKHLDRAGSGLSTKLSAVFAPAMAKVIDYTVDWTVANREVISQSLDRKLTSIGHAFSFIAGTLDKFLAIPFVAEMTKGWDASTGFDVALGVLGVTMAGPVFAAFQVVTGAILRMTAAMLTNPYLALGAILVGVAVELVNHWGEVKAAVSDAFAAWGPIGAVFQVINVGVNLVFAAINDLAKALFGIDLEKWGADFGNFINRNLDAFLVRIEKAWQWITRIKNVFASAAVATASAASDAAATEAGLVPPSAAPTILPPQAPPPDSPAAQAAQGKPQQVEIVLSGDIKAPPGSTITATAKGGTQPTSLNVGRSMHDGYGA